METRDSDELRRGYRRVIALGFVSFFTDISTEMILGILPLFIISVGGNPGLLGLIEGVAELANNALRVISGRLSDKLGKRKLFVIVGYCLSSVSKPLFAFSSTVAQVLAVRAADRIGKGVRTPPRDALISAYVPRARAGTAFGLHRTLDQSGAIIGPLIAFILFPILMFQGLFLLSFVPALAALIILFLYVKEVRIEQRSTSSLFQDAKGLLRGDLLILLTIIGVFSLGAFSFSFILLRASLTLPIESAALVTLVYLVINVTHTAIGIPSGSLSDKIGKEKVLLLGYCVFILTSLLGVVLDNSYSSGLLLGAVFGFYIGINETVQRALIPKYAPSNLLGTAYSLYYLIAGTAALGANALFGAIWLLYSPSTAFTFSLVLSVVAAAALLAFLRLRRA